MVNISYNTFKKSFTLVAGMFLALFISSCGKSTTTNAVGLNIQYQVLNLSPDLAGVNLYVDFNRSSGPYIYGVKPRLFFGKFHRYTVPNQVGTYLQHTYFIAGDILKPNLKYSLYIIGNVADNSVKSLFTVDTATIPTIGRGKIRFVNVSPTTTGGLDITVNGTTAFSKVVYNSYSKFLALPVGSYDFKITATGSSTILKELPAVPIQDGRVYTIYTYGYTTRVDSAAFNAQVTTNK